MSIFSYLIIEQIPGLRRYARALTGGKKENADDLVQDTLERAYAKWHLFRLGTDLRPWLFSIMHNVFVNEMRLLKNRVLIGSIDDERIGIQSATQLDHVLVRETLAAVGRLTPALREVLILVTIETFSYVETAKILDIPLGTVMSRLARARAQLRAMMGEPTRGDTRATMRLVE
jgi:RNA polymerase sigma-70 factor (ECF subfamily)